MAHYEWTDEQIAQMAQPTVDDAVTFMAWWAVWASPRDKRAFLREWDGPMPRDMLIRTIRRVATGVMELGNGLRANRGTLPNWQTQMADFTIMGQLAGALMASRGVDFLDRYAVRLQYLTVFQLEKLRSFARQVDDEAGFPLDGRFIRRSQMYVWAAIAAYHVVEGEVMAEEHQADLYRNIRTAADSCDECVYLEGLGWVPVNSLPPVGSRQCLSNCLCYFEYQTPDGLVIPSGY